MASEPEKVSADIEADRLEEIAHKHFPPICFPPGVGLAPWESGEYTITVGGDPNEPLRKTCIAAMQEAVAEAVAARRKAEQERDMYKQRAERGADFALDVARILGKYSPNDGVGRNPREIAEAAEARIRELERDAARQCAIPAPMTETCRTVTWDELTEEEKA